MIYNAFKDMKLSALGMGNMRLPVVDGNDAVIDEAATEAILDYCMTHGINYYDTAWGYHSGNSELVVGKLLQKYPRESFYLASKFPGYDLSNMGKVEEIFEQQLQKCRIGCRACEQVCPQQIHIPDALADFAARVGQKG